MAGEVVPCELVPGELVPGELIPGELLPARLCRGVGDSVELLTSVGDEDLGLVPPLASYDGGRRVEPSDLILCSTGALGGAVCG